MRLYKEKYRCSQCGVKQEHFVWDNEIEKTTHKCTNCQYELTYDNVVFITKTPPTSVPIILTKMTKQEIQVDRRKRSTEHFKKEILPTIGGKDRRHFERKFKR